MHMRVVMARGVYTLNDVNCFTVLVVKQDALFKVTCGELGRRRLGFEVSCSRTPNGSLRTLGIEHQTPTLNHTYVYESTGFRRGNRHTHA